MRVIDASALAKYVNREDGWERVEEHLLRGCVTLDLALKEVANSLLKRVKRGDLGGGKAVEVVRALLENKIVRIAPEQPLLVEALELSIKTGLTIYDSTYIVLARRLGTELITSDRKQAEKAEEAGVIPILV
ncbi:MAG: type II toxin-antitoxin system VapC family toxin [Thaumarchaeota archaeon]|nr:type II toxin-antitoxin system VapC family toxin [Nitrososphaerota archaeon]